MAAKTMGIRKFFLTKTQTALILVILVLAMGLRVGVIRWGWVSDTSLRQAGYPDSLLLSGPGAVAGGEEGRIYGSLVYDESNYAIFLPWLSRLHGIREKIRNGELTVVSGIWAGYRASYLESHLALNPVAPMVMGLATVAIASWGYGIPFTDEKDALTVFYRFGRWFALAMVFPALGVFLLLWCRLGCRRDGAWILMGTVGFLFQHAILTHGRFIGYNLAMLTLELGLIAGFDIYISKPFKISHKILMAAAGGLVLGLALATKLTVAPAGFCIGLGLLVHGVQSKRQGEKRFRALLPAVAFILMAASAVLFFFLPALLTQAGNAGLANQERMLLGLADLNSGTYGSRVWIYFLKTLPAALGWPVYLTGGLGLLMMLRQVAGRGSEVQKPNLPTILLGSLLICLCLYPSNPLGLEVQRSLTIIAYGLLLAGYAMSRGLESQSSGAAGKWKASTFRIALKMWGVYLLVGMVFSACSTTWQFSQEHFGYRNRMTAWMLKNIPQGATIWCEGQGPDTFSDLALVEMAGLKNKANFFKWEYHLAEAFQKESPPAWGHYYALGSQDKPAVLFQSTLKQEGFSHHLVRMVFGYHRWDQILNQPDFAIFSPSIRKSNE